MSGLEIFGEHMVEKSLVEATLAVEKIIKENKAVRDFLLVQVARSCGEEPWSMNRLAQLAKSIQLTLCAPTNEQGQQVAGKTSACWQDTEKPAHATIMVHPMLLEDYSAQCGALASTILHEVCHSLRYSCYPSHKTYVDTPREFNGGEFVEDATCPHGEIGLAFQVAVLGGVSVRHDSTWYIEKSKQEPQVPMDATGLSITLGSPTPGSSERLKQGGIFACKEDIVTKCVKGSRAVSFKGEFQGP
mmetsp:Transcript_51985/g.96204  ORF Transcript_51985/g.96204 Transcript_51985/m.96204 type:complete len:245 (-) Transcript_51985:54-788(-)